MCLGAGGLRQLVPLRAGNRPAHGFTSLLPKHRADPLTISTHFLPLAVAPVARLLPGAPSLFRDQGEWGAAFCSLGLRFIGRPCTWLFPQSLCLPTAWGSPAPLWGFLPVATLFKSLMVENHHLSSPSTLLSCPRPFPHNQVSVKCQAVPIALPIAICSFSTSHSFLTALQSDLLISSSAQTLLLSHCVARCPERLMHKCGCGVFGKLVE